MFVYSCSRRCGKRIIVRVSKFRREIDEQKGGGGLDTTREVNPRCILDLDQLCAVYRPKSATFLAGNVHKVTGVSTHIHTHPQPHTRDQSADERRFLLFWAYPLRCVDILAQFVKYHSQRPVPCSSIRLTMVCEQNAVRRIVPAVGEVYESVFNISLLVSMRAYASESLLVYKRL